MPDIEDAVRLAEFNHLLPQWRTIFSGDPHSIFQQISQLVLSHTTWQSLNEARRLNLEAGRRLAPPMITVMIDRGFFLEQIIGISKLVDRHDVDNQERGVISLARLLADIGTHRHLITREIFVCKDGHPYDYAAAYQAEMDMLLARGNGAVCLGPGAMVSELMHRTFDKLARVDENQRDRSDLISEHTIANLASILNDYSILGVVELRNKIYAHAGDEFSRNASRYIREPIRLADLQRALEKIVAVYKALALILFQEERSIDILNLDMHDGWDIPLIPTDGLRPLREHAEKFSADMDQHISDAFRAIFPV